MSKQRWQLAWFVAVMLAMSFLVSAQVTVPYPNFTAGTIADPAQVNADFAALSTGALNRTGGTMTGTLVTRGVLPASDNTYTLGSGSFRYSTITATTFVGGLATSNLTGLVPIANGGTNGSGTPTAGGAIYGTGTAYAVTAAGSAGQVLTSNGAAAPTWANGGVPAGMVMYSTSGSCPTGWAEYTAARGRYVVGLPSGGTNAGTSGTVLSDLESRAVGQHTHSLTMNPHTHTTYIAGGDGGTPETDDTGSGNGTQGAANPANLISATTDTGTIANAGSVAGTNAPYVQLMACQKS